MNKKQIHLLFFLLFLLSMESCREDFVTPSKENVEESTKIIKRINAEAIQKVPLLSARLQTLGKEIKGEQQLTGKTYEDVEYGYTIDTDNALYIESSSENKTYTFKIEREVPQAYLENLVLKDLGDGTFDAYIAQYDSIIVNHQEQITDMEYSHIQFIPIGVKNAADVFGKADDCEFTVIYEIPHEVLCTGRGNHRPGENCICDLPQGNCTPGHYEGVDYEEVTYHYPCAGGGANGGNTGDNGTGNNDTGGGTGDGGISTSPFPPHINGGSSGGLDAAESTDPCEKIMTLRMNAAFNAKFTTLNTDEKLNYDHEVGFSVQYNMVYGDQYQPMSNKPGTSSVRLSDNGNHYGYMHTHNESEFPDYSIRIFSPQDIVTFLTTCVRNAQEYGTISDAYCVVITTKGNYILKYTGDGSYNIGPNQVKNWQTWYEKNYRMLIDDAEGEDIEQADVEELFTQFLEEVVNIDGLEVYQLNNDLTSSRLTYNGENNTVKKENCTTN